MADPHAEGEKFIDLMPDQARDHLLTRAAKQHGA